MKTLILLLLLTCPCFAGPTLIMVKHVPACDQILDGDTGTLIPAIDEKYIVKVYGLNADGSAKTIELKGASELKKIVDIEEANYPELIAKPRRMLIYFNPDQSIQKLDYHIPKSKIIEVLNNDSKTAITTLKTLIESK